MGILVTLIVGFACCFLSANQFTNCIPWIVMCGFAIRSIEQKNNSYVWLASIIVSIVIAIIACYFMEGAFYYGFIATVEYCFFMYLERRK